MTCGTWWQEEGPGDTLCDVHPADPRGHVPTLYNHTRQRWLLHGPELTYVSSIHRDVHQHRSLDILLPHPK